MIALAALVGTCTIYEALVVLACPLCWEIMGLPMYPVLINTIISLYGLW